MLLTRWKTPSKLKHTSQTGWPTSPSLLDSTFHSRALSNIRVCTSSNQLSFGRLLGYVLVGSVLLFHLFFFFFFHPRPNGRNINAGSFFFFIASHIVPLVVSLSEVGWPRWRLSFKLLDTLDFSLSFLPYSHILSSCFKHTWIYCLSHKKTQPLRYKLIHYRIQVTDLNTFRRL